MSLAKLTSLSAQTLSLLLERQRLQSLPPAGVTRATNSSLHLPQITRNLAQLRSGILELESIGDHREAIALLRTQHVRMRDMVGSDVVIEALPESTKAHSEEEEGGEEARSWSPPGAEKTNNTWSGVGEHVFTPYTDDPEAGRDPSLMLQEQRRLLDGVSSSGAMKKEHSFNEICGLQIRMYI
ncbi:hypothetical protein B0F90DRAFT_1724689 [Multifurca ochricompacta]|uniref:Uncharacterized protein n=1 Tax=Multifurca ochricompacta TaxID=376703 RepID=A0AAD4M596_9AGAM|nr:hypothetical protein B0F90DRAFT_1724689 [Multifurca ochricompacta]